MQYLYFSLSIATVKVILNCCYLSLVKCVFGKFVLIIFWFDFILNPQNIPIMNTPDSPSFWQYDPEYWYKTLQSGKTGLTNDEALQKLKDIKGKQRVQSSFEKDVKLFVRQFSDPLMLMLIAAVILAGFLGETSDVVIIAFVVLASGILSFIQERNAGKVVEKLQALLSLRSKVIREGELTEINSADVVPGDVVVISAGDIIPADCLITEANELYLNEASLTGESFPVRKSIGTLPIDTPLARRDNCTWEGTSVVSGSGKAVVINVGQNTMFGNIVHNSNVHVETSFEKGIKDFGFLLMRITLVLSVFILVVNLLNHKSVIDSALFALALAVGMAPELLPAINTIAMSAGAKRMLDKKVIVKKLSSVQSLGEVNLLCTDKTGTITEGVINISKIVDTAGNPSDFVGKISYWNAAFESGYSNPIDDALKSLKPSADALPAKIGEIPYDFNRKRLSIAVDTGQEKLLISKGAYNEISSICTSVRLSDGSAADFAKIRADIDQHYLAYGTDGYRAIAVCYKPLDKTIISKEDESDMIFAGFILLNDPVKQDIPETLARLRELKVGLKIITGDNVNVAKSIGRTIGIDDPVVMSGKEVISLTPEALRVKVRDTQIFAEVEPMQKQSIILALKKSYTVAYMGDGINDVSAINAADIGISVSNAVAVAREAADFVLMEKDLIVLAEGITEGRKTFANTLKYIYINTGSTFGNMCSVAVASLALPFLPMLPKQILITNFITDFPYLAVASDDVDTQQLQAPGKWNMKTIRNYMLIFGVHSSLFDMITFVTLLYFLKVQEAGFQTGWFVESTLTELCILFIIRTQNNFFKSKPGKWLSILSAVALVITIILPYTPLGVQAGMLSMPLLNMGAIILIVVLYLLTTDLLKVWFFRKFKAG